MGIEAELGTRYAGVVRRLQMAGRSDMQTRMAKRIRQRGAPAVAAVKAAFRTAELPARPSRGGVAPSGLRNRAASSVRASTTRGGVSIQANGRRVDPRYGTSLLLALNGLAKLRHPVFGNRAVWVTQKGTADHWYGVLDPYAAQWRADVERVMDDIVREIEG
jgi:hypothetical protein